MFVTLHSSNRTQMALRLQLVESVITKWVQIEVKLIAIRAVFMPHFTINEHEAEVAAPFTTLHYFVIQSSDDRSTLHALTSHKNYILC